jgi:SAM-dependent methyltransferase
MVSRNDVIAAYRLILGREPENEQVIEGWMQTESIDQLRQAFMSGEEFSSKLKSKGFFANIASVGRNIHGPRMQLDLHISSTQLEQMLKEVTETWSRLGQTEPHWSVLTSGKFKQEHITKTEAEFYETGAVDLQTIRDYFDRCSENIAAMRTVVELGCGVGRITSHLSSAFPNVIGVDVSAAHLKVAQSYFDRVGIRNVRLVQLSDLDTINSLPDFDLFFSIISLQHSAPPIVDAMLERVMAKAKPGAFLLFQIPTYREGYSFSVSTYSKQQHPDMEVHLLPQRRIFELFRSSDFEVIEVQEDNLTGDPAFTSQTFFARKAKPRSFRLFRLWPG